MLIESTNVFKSLPSKNYVKYEKFNAVDGNFLRNNGAGYGMKPLNIFSLFLVANSLAFSRFGVLITINN